MSFQDSLNLVNADEDESRSPNKYDRRIDLETRAPINIDGPSTIAQETVRNSQLSCNLFNLRCTLGKPSFGFSTSGLVLMAV
jgi:hypothetical protein